MNLIAIFAIYSPLAGFILSKIIKLKIANQILTCSLMSVALVASFLLFVYHDPPHTTFILCEWIHMGRFLANWGIRLDTLSKTMMLLVNLISWLVHIHSLGYMSHDPRISRFMGYLGFFTWAMLMLVSAPNLLQLFFGWEGVGVASYMLIGYWNQRPAATIAALKAFLVNRVSDVGLLLGISCVFSVFNTIDFDTLMGSWTIDPSVNPQLTLAALLCFWGAMGKSAQIGFHIWLPDAMEAPTPVSALIHAATMVTAGVFLVLRLSFLFELAPLAKQVVLVVGLCTAFYGATVALTQTDIKRILAYSTCSQVGYMFMALGSSAYAAALFHLVTHAFFKALLFLGAGSIIHALSGEQDIRRMGGLFKPMRFTCYTMWFGTFSLIGLPFFSGFYSKDQILTQLLTIPSGLRILAYVGGILIISLTTFYALRLMLLVFHAPSHEEKHISAVPLSMKLPLLGLMVGTLLLGGFPKIPHLGTPALSTLMILSGGIATYYGCWRNPQITPTLTIYLFFWNKWYFDEFFQRFLINPILALGAGFKKDELLIDRYGPDGLARIASAAAHAASRLQTGYLYHYALTIIIGLVLMMTLCF